MTTEEFYEKLISDPELQKKFIGVDDPEKFYQICQENGLTDDKETMVAAGKKLASRQELDDDQLEAIAGGQSAAGDEALGKATAVWVGAVVVPMSTALFTAF